MSAIPRVCEIALELDDCRTRIRLGRVGPLGRRRNAPAELARIQKAAARHVLYVGPVKDPSLPSWIDTLVTGAKPARHQQLQLAAAAPAREGSRFRGLARSRSARSRTARFARTVPLARPVPFRGAGKLRADLSGDVRQVRPRRVDSPRARADRVPNHSTIGTAKISREETAPPARAQSPVVRSFDPLRFAQSPRGSAAGRKMDRMSPSENEIDERVECLRRQNSADSDQQNATQPWPSARSASASNPTSAAPLQTTSAASDEMCRGSTVDKRCR